MSTQTGILKLPADEQRLIVLTKIWEVLGISSPRVGIWVLVGKSLRNELESFFDSINLDEHQRNILERITEAIAPLI